VSSRTISPTRTRRRLLRELLALTATGPAAAFHPLAAAAQQGVTTPDGRYYDAYVPAATKQGQFYHYTCEFDAAWVVLKTFGYDVGLEEQLAIVGQDTSVVPYYEDAGDGTFVIHGGDITTAYSGDYYNDFLARTTGQAMLPLFQHYGLDATPVHSREGIEATLNKGGLVWMKATADFLPGADTTWITPSGVELPTVLGNDHAVVVMGYNDNGPVIRDVLGPTSSNWNRVYEYDVPWETFLGVFNAQGGDGIGVLPPGAAPPDQTIQSSDPAPDPAAAASEPNPAAAAQDVVQVCC
jgi:uncharacterized protein YvpB